MANKPWTIIELLGNGSLLFFATTITSKTAGEYFKRVRGHHAIATPMCVICLISILLPSVFAYGIEAATRVGVTASESLSPGRVTRVSLFLAGSAILFSLSYTLFVHAFGD